MSSHYYHCEHCNAERRFEDGGVRQRRHCFECNDLVVFERGEAVGGEVRDKQIRPEERIEMLRGD